MAGQATPAPPPPPTDEAPRLEAEAQDLYGLTPDLIRAIQEAIEDEDLARAAASAC